MNVFSRFITGNPIFEVAGITFHVIMKEIQLKKLQVFVCSIFLYLLLPECQIKDRIAYDAVCSLHIEERLMT